MSQTRRSHHRWAANLPIWQAGEAARFGSPHAMPEDTPTSQSPGANHEDVPTSDSPSRPAWGATPRRPTRIGQYTLLRVLGEGGFGCVYLARQDVPARDVAIKVLRADVGSRQAYLRFSHEAETLARLSHPGIAQVFEAGFYDPDTGSTHRDPNGALHRRPFFAMEYIQGAPLIEFARGIGVRARLDLLRRVCDAVQHAHLSGVVHRDLKPANILVDRSGHPRVLDFGVARITNEDVRRATMQTDAGQIVGTVPYMSPEQISGDPGALDTRSDVYTLGVLLFEVLTGRLPYDLDRKLLHQATRTICEAAPLRLGAVNRSLRGDLETIALKALEKEKVRRYQSAADLAEDLRRFAADEPIRARPPSRVYELRKFAVRNRALVGGIAATILVLAVGVAGTGYQAVRATRAEAEEFVRRTEAEGARLLAEAQKAQAAREAARANAAVGFLVSALEAADPDQKGRDVRLADVLDGAVAEIDESLADQPGVAATLRVAVSRAYAGLGLHAEALAQASRAVETLTDLHGPEHPEALDARNTLADVLIGLARYEEAERELEAIHAAHVAREGPDSRPALEMLNAMAAMYAGQGRLEDALRAARRASDRSRALHGAEDAATLSYTFELAQILAAAERADEAEPLFDSVLEARVRTLPSGDRKIQNVREALGELYRMQGRYDEAARVHAATLEAFQQKFGPEHPRTLSKAGDLGKALQQANRLDEAEAVLRPALEASLRVNGQHHFDTLTLQGFLSDVLHSQGNAAEAADLRRAVSEARARTLGPDHPQTLIAWTNTAFVLIDLARYDEAGTICRDLLERRERIYGPEHNEVGVTLAFLGLIEIKRGDGASAEVWYRRCLAIREKAFPEGNGIRGLTMNGLGYALSMQGKHAEAEPLITTGAEWVLTDPRAPLRNKRDAVDRAVKLYEAWGRPEQVAAWRAKSPE